MLKKNSFKKIQTPKYGAEVEMPIIDQETGKSASIPGDYFQKLAELKTKKGEQVKNLSEVEAGGKKVMTKKGEYETDNGYNLLETAFQPESDLAKLNQNIILGLHDTIEILAQHGLTIANVAEHPNQPITQEFYEKMVAKKPVYPLLLQRGWDHKQGIDAKAQNSPSTEVSPEYIVEAVNSMFLTSFATIALTANSPFEAGQITGNKANRLTLWNRMFANSTAEGDRKTSQFPQKPFTDIADYWNWMHGEGTTMHFVLRSEGDYKHSTDFITVDEQTHLLTYLLGINQKGRNVKTGELVNLQPSLNDLEIQQFAQFSASRIRFKFKATASIDDFRTAFKQNPKKPGAAQQWFNQNVQFAYIEGRDAEANFPDQELMNIDQKMAKNVLIAPSVLQAGIIRNSEKINSQLGISWQKAIELREKAIKYGLSDNEVYEYTQKVYELTHEHLSSSEQEMLSYFDFCLKTRQNGADRALAILEKMPGNTPGEKMLNFAKNRNIVLPSV